MFNSWKTAKRRKQHETNDTIQIWQLGTTLGSSSGDVSPSHRILHGQSLCKRLQREPHKDLSVRQGGHEHHAGNTRSVSITFTSCLAPEGDTIPVQDLSTSLYKISAKSLAKLRRSRRDYFAETLYMNHVRKRASCAVPVV